MCIAREADMNLGWGGQKTVLNSRLNYSINFPNIQPCPNF
jgi:hypothetical protein